MVRKLSVDIVEKHGLHGTNSSICNYGDTPINSYSETNLSDIEVITRDGITSGKQDDAI